MILFCMGCLSALATAPLYAWPLVMVGYSTLVIVLIQSPNWKSTFKSCFLFFFGFFIVSLYWISNSLFIDLERWWWALPFSLFGLPSLLSLFPTVIVTLASFIPRYRWIVFISALILADLARGHLFTGFPWNMPAHVWAQTDMMMEILPHIGFYGLNGLTIILFSLPALFIGFWALIPLLSFLFFHPIGQEFQVNNLIFKKTDNQAIEEPYDMTMVQMNILQNEKWNPQLMWSHFSNYIDKSAQSVSGRTKPQIIIWPETALSESFLTYDQPKQKLNGFLANLPLNSYLITGYLVNNRGMATNSLAVFNRQGRVVRQYNKHHLVPFGEYMPFGLDTITGFNNFTAGSRPSPIEINDLDFSFLPLICYEIIFPSYSKMAKNNDFIINITNDAWFGKTAGPYQHFDHARFRAIENHKPVIRLSGNGISAIISPYGHVKNMSLLNKTDIFSIKKQKQ